MAVRDENMQIAVRVAQCLRDVSAATAGEMVLQNFHSLSWQGNTLVVRHHDEKVFMAPISELAELSTAMWG